MVTCHIYYISHNKYLLRDVHFPSQWTSKICQQKSGAAAKLVVGQNWFGATDVPAAAFLAGKSSMCTGLGSVHLVIKIFIVTIKYI